MEKLSNWILKFRYGILVVVAAITLFLGYFIKDIQVNPDVIGYHPAGDEAAALFMEIGRQYGGNDLLIVGIESDNIFTYEMLNLVRKVTDSVRSVPGISSVTSLTNVLHISSSEYGIEIGRLVDEFNIPTDTLQLRQLQEYTLSEPMYSGFLVSKDATATLVVARVKDGTEQMVIVDQVKQKLEGLEFDGNFYFGGMPVILRELSSVIIGDLFFIAPIAFLLITLVLFWGFRNLQGVLLPMLTVVIAIIWTMGLMSMLGYQLTLLTNLIPVILLAVGSAYSIHIVNRFFREKSQAPAEAIQRTLRYVALPVILASITTIFGFVSFIAGSYLTMIVEFGIFSSLGIFFSLILALSFAPAMLSVFSDKGIKTTKDLKKINQVEKLTQIIGGWVQNHPRKIVAIWLLLVVAGIWGATKIERRVDLVDYFRRDNIVKQSEYLLREKFTGSMPLFVKITGDIQSPDALRLMQNTQDFMAQFDYIPYSQSVADLIIQMNDAMGEGRHIPEEREKIEQLWFLLDGQEVMEQLVNFELTEGLVIGHVASTDLEVLREIEVNFAEFAQQNSDADFDVQVTGIPIFFKRLDESIIQSQTSSIIIATSLIILVISLMMRSLWKGILGVVPILVTLLILFGTMGLTGVPLDIATVLCGSITIGIGVDYAIHFMTQFAKSFRATNNTKQSISETISISGRAILINMIAVSLGFAVLMFSNLVPMQRFGLLIALTMISTSMATLTLLPLCLSISGERLQRMFKK